MKKLIKKINSRRAYFLLMVAVLVAACSNAQNSQKNNSPDLCMHVNTIVQKETTGKISQDSTILFIAAKDKKEAFNKAQNLVIKMNARLIQKNDTVYTYELPEENTSIQYIERKDDKCLYAILYLQIQCENFPLKEIHYMRLRCYNNL